MAPEGFQRPVKNPHPDAGFSVFTLTANAPYLRAYSAVVLAQAPITFSSPTTLSNPPY